MLISILFLHSHFGGISAKRRNMLHYLMSILLILLRLKNVLADTCSFNAKVSQSLLNEGFHRNITYGVVFSNTDEVESWMHQDCIIALDQTLPPGVYANPDELGEFRRSNKLNAIPKNRINIELPAEQSEASSVYIIGLVADSKVYLWLPVHARYHRAMTGGGTARNRIEPPKLYLRCPDLRLDACGTPISPSVTFLCNGSPRDKCSWKEISYTMMTDTLSWDVPVGNLSHYYPVAAATALVILTGSMYLLRAIHQHKLECKKRL